jgi:hypothetical protein
MRILGRSRYDKSCSRLGFREGLDFWSCEVEEDEEDDVSESPAVGTVAEGAVVVVAVVSTSIVTLSVDSAVVVPDSSIELAGVGSAVVVEGMVESIWASLTDEVKESALGRFVGDVVLLLVVVDGSFVI